MHSTASIATRALAVGVAAILHCAAAGATPTSLTAGSTVTVGTYTGTGTPTATVLSSTGAQEVSFGSGSLVFDEAAVLTNLNPAGVTFAFVIAATGPVGDLSVELPGFGAYTTSVEACDPLTLLGQSAGCGPSPGTASRDASGNVTFNDVAFNGGIFDRVSDVYGVFTNAASASDPSVCVTQVGGTLQACFSALVPAGAAGGGNTGNAVPEPGTLALLSLALGALALRRRSSPRAVPLARRA